MQTQCSHNKTKEEKEWVKEGSNEQRQWGGSVLAGLQSGTSLVVTTRPVDAYCW